MNNALIYNPATWLDQFFTDFDKAVGHKKSFSPAIDIVEEEEAFVLRAELPGVSKENIKVEVKENRLTLSGKKDTVSEGGKGQYRYAESSHGEFTRTFELPRNVNGDAIKAEYVNGVLTLRIPKGKDALPRSIEIG
jgi:HSP20 family protein